MSRVTVMYVELGVVALGVCAALVSLIWFSILFTRPSSRRPVTRALLGIGVVISLLCGSLLSILSRALPSGNTAIGLEYVAVGSLAVLNLLVIGGIILYRSRECSRLKDRG